MWQIKVIDIGSSKYYGLHLRSNYKLTFDVTVTFKFKQWLKGMTAQVYFYLPLNAFLSLE